MTPPLRTLCCVVGIFLLSCSEICGSIVYLEQPTRQLSVDVGAWGDSESRQAVSFDLGPFEAAFGASAYETVESSSWANASGWHSSQLLPESISGAGGGTVKVFTIDGSADATVISSVQVHFALTEPEQFAITAGIESSQSGGVTFQSVRLCPGSEPWCADPVFSLEQNNDWGLGTLYQTGLLDAGEYLLDVQAYFDVFVAPFGHDEGHSSYAFGLFIPEQGTLALLVSVLPLVCLHRRRVSESRPGSQVSPGPATTCNAANVTAQAGSHEKTCTGQSWITLCLIAAMAAWLLSPAAARAVNQFWFEAHPASGNAGVLFQGGPGVNPWVNYCWTCGPRPEWDFDIMFSNDSTDLPILAWALDLYTNAEDDLVRVEQFTYDVPIPSFIGYSAVVLGSSPGAILEGAGAFDDNFPSGGLQGGPFRLATFRLSLPAWQQYVAYDYVYAIVGSNEWYDGEWGYPTLKAGANPPVVEGGVAGTELGAVMLIQEVPEPDVIALLGFGALLAVCGRRRASRAGPFMMINRDAGVAVNGAPSSRLPAAPL